MSFNNRREFLAGLAAAGMSSAATKLRSKCKIGCCSWCLHGYAPGANPEDAIETIGDLGFDSIELIVLDPADFRGSWSDAAVDRIRTKLESRRLQVTQVALFQRVVQALASPDAEVRARTLDNFEAGCKIARKLGAGIVNISSPQAEEMHGPATPVLVHYFELEDPKPGDKFHLDFAPSFDWGEIWQRFARTTKECLARAKAHGLRFTIEPHSNMLVHDGAAFLHLWDAIRDPSLGCNLDVGFAARQREYPPLVIYQLQNHLMNLHMRDIDGQMRKFVPFGDGVMDYKGIADALKAVGFEGSIAIEQDRKPDIKASCARYLETMRRCLA